MNSRAATGRKLPQAKDTDLEMWSTEIKERAKRRLGEISQKLETSKHGPGRGNKSLPNNGTPFKSAILKQAGISKSEAQAVKRTPQRRVA